MSQFVTSQGLAAMINAGKNVVNLGDAIGKPIAQGLATRYRNQRQDELLAQQTQRQDQLLADKYQREDDKLAAEQQRREDVGEAFALYNQFKEDDSIFRQTLSGKMVQARELGNLEDAEEYEALFNMDKATAEAELMGILMQNSDLLPSNALGGAMGLGGASDKNVGGRVNFVKQVGTDEETGKPIYQNFAQTLTQGNAGLTSQETAFGPSFIEGQPNPVNSSAIDKTAGQTQAKLDIESKELPKLRASILKATKRAESAADDESKLSALKANWPVIQDMAETLRALSTKATYTMAGKGFDLLLKEFGFGATKGSTARAKYQSVIDNQILPLLKATFGTAFTEGEGKRLTATLGDPDAAPEEKIAQLDAFLSSQQSQMDTLERKMQPKGDRTNGSPEDDAKIKALEERTNPPTKRQPLSQGNQYTSSSGITFTVKQ